MILKKDKDIYENVSVLEESIPIYLYAIDIYLHEPNYSLRLSSSVPTGLYVYL